MASQIPSIDLLGHDSDVFVDVVDLALSPPLSLTSSTGNLTSNSTNTRRTAWIYNHMPDPDSEKRYYDNSQREIWICQYCRKTYQISGGTRLPAKHLQKEHDIPDQSARQVRNKRQQSSIENAIKLGDQLPQKRRRLEENSGDSICGDHLEVLFVKFITSCNLPLRIVECPTFRDLLYYLNRDIDSWLPKSHSTVKQWILRQYDVHKQRVKQRILNARTIIHLSCDLWTSPNSLAIIGITAQYIAEDNKLERSVLALKEVEGEHSGENLAKYIIEVIVDWGFASKLGYFQMDNAGNNDTMLREISLRTYSTVLSLNILY